MGSLNTSPPQTTRGARQLLGVGGVIIKYMKLLFCKKCRSIFNINLKEKTCECGLTKGMYTDNLNAIYTGRNARPMGIDNYSFAYREARKPINSENIEEMLLGKYIKMWFIEKKDCCTTFIKLNKKEYEIKRILRTIPTISKV